MSEVVIPYVLAYKIEPEYIGTLIDKLIQAYKTNTLSKSIPDYISKGVQLEKARKIGLFPVNSPIEDWIDEYRQLFKGIKHLSMGSRSSCITKMRRFMKDNPKYVKEDILNAAKHYINETDPRYTAQADHFIMKQGYGSRLEATLEEMEIPQEVSRTDKLV